MIYNLFSQQTYPIIILAILVLKATSQIPVTFSQPSFMQANRFTVISTPTTISSNTQYTISYQNSFNGGGSLQACIAISGIQFLINNNFTINCNPGNPNSAHLPIICTTTTSVIKLSYSYFVFFQNQYTTITVFSNFTVILGGNQNNTVSNTHSFQFTRYVTVIRGIAILATGLDSFFRVYELGSAQTSLRYLSQSSGLTGTLYLTIININISPFIFNQNMRLIQYTDIYEFGAKTSPSVSEESLSTHMAFIGLRELSLTNNTNMRFSFSYNDPSPDTIFPTNTPIASMRYLVFSQASCPAGYQIQWGSRTCRNTRNQCSTYYQYIQDAAMDSVRIAKIHSSGKIIAIASNYQVRTYRHNGSTFELYKSFRIPNSSCTIKKMYVSKDFSRIAVLTATCGLFTYAWDGMNYILEYKYPYSASAYNDFSISDDFKLIGLITFTSGNYFRKTIKYDNNIKRYIQGIQIPILFGRFIINNPQTNETFILASEFIYHTTFQSNYGVFIAFKIETSGPVSQFNYSYSDNYRVIALDYHRGNVPKNKYIYYGIRILHYDATQKLYKHHSFIQSSVFNSFAFINQLKLSSDGLQLAIKGTTGSIDVRVIFKRDSLQNYFSLSEILGKLPQSSSSLAAGILNSAIDATPNFSIIVSSDNKANLVVYYCPSDISEPSNIFNISTAQQLWLISVNSNYETNNTQSTTNSTSTGLNNNTPVVNNGNSSSSNNLPSPASIINTVTIKNQSESSNNQNKTIQKMQFILYLGFSIVGCVSIATISGLIYLCVLIKASEAKVNPENQLEKNEEKEKKMRAFHNRSQSNVMQLQQKENTQIQNSAGTIINNEGWKPGSKKSILIRNQRKRRDIMRIAQLQNQFSLQ